MARIFSSFRLRLVMMILITTVPVMAIAILGPSVMAERSVRKEARNSLAQVARGLSDKVLAWDEQVVNVLHAMANNPAIRSMDVEQQRPVLRRIATVYNWFHLVCIVQPSGLNVARADDQSPKYYHDREWFIGPMAGRESVRQTVISRTTNLPGLTIGMPIRGNDGKVIGVVGVGMSLTRLTESVGAASIGGTGIAFVVDDRGLLIAHPLLGPSERLIDYSDFPPVDALLRKQKTGDFAFVDNDGNRWISHLVRVPNGWGVISMQREAEVLSEAARIRTIGTLAAVMATMLVGGLTWWLATRITRPVRELTDAAEQLAAGKWGVSVTGADDLPEGRRDELGRLAVAFNRMASSLQKSYRLVEERVLQRTEQLRKSNTELREAREVAYAHSRAKDEFLANMSHELRTPMTTIIGYANLLADPQLPTDQRINHVGHVQRSARHLLSIINEVLDLSSIEAGKLAVAPDRVDIANAVDDAVASLKPRADEKRIELHASFAPDVPRFIQTDGRRLRQILINLLGNAIKFTEAGSVRVHVSFVESILPPDKPTIGDGGLSDDQIVDETSVPTGPWIRVDVTDTGIGMTEEQVGRLFERFSQVDTSPSRKFAGTGLGLVISKRLAQMLGGGISVVSETGKGSTFSATIAAGEKYRDDETAVTTAQSSIAIDAQPPAVIEPVAAPESSIDGALKNLRVLLAEDVAMNRQLFIMILKKLGATVSAVGNGQEAIDVYNELSRAVPKPFDVILMDMQMPEVDGYEATQRLRADGVTTPIIALTAHASESDRQACMAAGCTDFVTKPLDPQVLVSTILQHVRASQ